MYKVLGGLGGKGSSCGLGACCNYFSKKKKKSLINNWLTLTMPFWGLTLASPSPFHVFNRSCIFWPSFCKTQNFLLTHINRYVPHSFSFICILQILMPFFPLCFLLMFVSFFLIDKSHYFTKREIYITKAIDEGEGKKKKKPKK